MGMAGIKPRTLIACAVVAEVLTLAVRFLLPLLQGRAFPDPHFPRVIVFHRAPPSCIVDFQGNFFAAVAESTVGLTLKINRAPSSIRIRFDSLAEHYLKFDFGADAVRPKTERTTLNTRQIVRSYLLPRWGCEIADDIKPIDLQRWFQSLHSNNGLAWTTVSKFRGTMLRVYKIGLLHELVTRNPVQAVETRSITDYKAILVTPPDARNHPASAQSAASHSGAHVRGYRAARI